MSILREAFRLLILAAVASTGSGALAQTWHPFAEPLEFDPDWQFMAPARIQDLEELSTRQRASTGWFVTYDRARVGMSRPNTNDPGWPSNGATQPGYRTRNQHQIDFTWGNRWDFGWMGEENHGWSFTHWNISGPNTYFDNQVFRPGFINVADPGDPIDPIFPSVNRNDPLSGERTYLVRESLNVATLNGFEANKTWRMPPLARGGYLETSLGMRYVGFTNYARNDVYNNSDVAAVTWELEVVDDPFPAVLLNVEREFFTHDRLDTVITRSANQMALGQVGLRYVNYYKKWTLSSDFKFFFGPNFQSTNREHRHISTLFDGGGPLPSEVSSTFVYGDGVGGVGLYPSEAFQVADSRTSFVVGFDTRLEAAYKVTRYLDVRGGFNLMYFGTGVNRRPNPAEVELLGDTLILTPELDVVPPNGFGVTVLTNERAPLPPNRSRDEALVVPGFTFGITLNR